MISCCKSLKTSTCFLRAQMSPLAGLSDGYAGQAARTLAEGRSQCTRRSCLTPSVSASDGLLRCRFVLRRAPLYRLRACRRQRHSHGDALGVSRVPRCGGARRDMRLVALPQEGRCYGRQRCGRGPRSHLRVIERVKADVGREVHFGPRSSVVL
mgnify:CR=1 FL=1